VKGHCYAAAINSALKERHDDLVAQLVAGESERFFKVDICVLNGPGPNTADIYHQGDDPAEWMENLAGWLLGRRYPTLPLDTHILDEPICEDDISEFFASIFDQPGSDPGLLRYFGPALGLIADGPEISFDPSACPVFPMVRELTGSTQISFAEVHRRLAHDVGLTEQLASLYLLLFINRAPRASDQVNRQRSDIHGRWRDITGHEANFGLDTPTGMEQPTGA
jgi:hypothetical protein